MVLPELKCILVVLLACFGTTYGLGKYLSAADGLMQTLSVALIVCSVVGFVAYTERDSCEE